MPLTMIADPVAQRLAVALFVTLLATACVTDVRSRLIPNRLVLLIAAGGLALSLLAGPWPSAPLRSLAGLATGLAIWFPLYLLRMLGAGDVKFFAAASAWLGPAVSVQAAVWTALVGGLLAAVWLVRVGGLTGLMLRLNMGARLARAVPDHAEGPTPRPAAAAPPRLPYGIAMATGIVIAALRS